MTPGRALGRGAILLLACGAGPCIGAASRLDPPELDRYVRWGPLRTRPGVELSSLGYDDNILATTTDPVADYTATVSPHLEGLVLFGSRAFLTFDERLDLIGYLDNTDQSYVDQSGRGRLTVPFGRMGVFGGLRLDRTKERPLDLEDLRTELAADAASFGFIVRPGARTEFEIEREATSYRYSDPDSALEGQRIDTRLGRTERRTTLEVDYRLVGRTRLTLDVSQSDIDFDSLDDDGRDKDSTGYGIYPGLDFGERGTLSGSLRLGVAAIDGREARRDDYRGFAGEAQLAYRPLPRGTLRVDARQEAAFSIYENTTYLLDRSVEVGWLYYVARAVGIDSSVRRGTLTFPEGGPNRVDRVREYKLGARLGAARTDDGRRIEYSFTLRYYDVDSSVDSLDRDRFSAGLGAAVGY